MMDKCGRRDENARSQTSKSSSAASLGSQSPQATEQPPKGSAQRGSASARRALFARRRLNASTSPPSGCASPPGTPPLNPQGAPLSPPRGQSTGSHQRSASSPSPSPSTSAMTPLLPPPSVVQPCGPQPSPAEIHPEDPLVTQRPSVGAAGHTHLSPHPTRPRGEPNLLSHLPLHSQQAGRAPSLLIPIGGIHMIQPRSLLPLYSLVSSPADPPAGTSWRRSDAPKGRASLLRQSSLKEASLGKAGSSQSDSRRQGGGCVQQPSSSPRAASTH